MEYADSANEIDTDALRSNYRQSREIDPMMFEHRSVALVVQSILCGVSAWHHSESRSPRGAAPVAHQSLFVTSVQRFIKHFDGGFVMPTKGASQRRR